MNYCLSLTERFIIMHSIRAGITVSEMLVGLCWFSLMGLLVLIWGGIGFVAWLAFTTAILAIGTVLYRYYVEAIVELDSVPCQDCGQVGQYKVERQGKRRIWRCACGEEYSFAGPTLRIARGTSGPRPYLRWKWWGKGRWCPANTDRS